MKAIRLVLWGLVLVVSAVVAGVSVGRMLGKDPSIAADSSLGAAMIRARYADAGGPFTMLDTSGDTVTAADFAGKPRAMFFGFTHCPDVCPTALVEARQWLEALGENAARINVMFVTVDPARDTPNVLRQYVGAFDDRIVGLVPPSEEALKDIAERYGIRYEKVPFADGDYTMNHTSDTLLFDADGSYAGFIPFTPMSARQDPDNAAGATDAAVEKLRGLIAS